jgi:type I restriction enzyme, S subunit
VPKITPSFENGKQGIVRDLPTAFGIATTEVIPIAELPGVSSREFLFYYLLKDDVRAALAAKMEGSTGRQRLRKDLLEELRIPFPPLPEQRAIAHVLSKLQAAAEAQAGIAEKARELKRALMAKLFTEGLRGEVLKETEIGPMPESWDVVRRGTGSGYSPAARQAEATPAIGAARSLG